VYEDKLIRFEKCVVTTSTISPEYLLYTFKERHAMAQWLRHCSTNRKLARSIPDGVVGIFH
jgi:hypothetical protein